MADNVPRLPRCKKPTVVSIDRHTIVSCDNRLDKKDQIRSADGKLKTGQDRSTIVNNLRQKLGVANFNNLSLANMARFFDLISRTRSRLRNKKKAGALYSIVRAFVDLSDASDDLKKTNFNNNTTRDIITSIAEDEIIKPGTNAARELLKKGSHAKLGDIWNILLYPPFASMTAMHLSNLVNNNQIISQVTEIIIKSYRKGLIEKGLSEAPMQVQTFLKKRPKERLKECVNLYNALSGIRDCAIEDGLKFDKSKMDKLIKQVLNSIPPNSKERALMTPPTAILIYNP